MHGWDKVCMCLATSHAKVAKEDSIVHACCATVLTVNGLTAMAWSHCTPLLPFLSNSEKPFFEFYRPFPVT